MANEGIEVEIYDFQDPTKKLDTLEGRQEPTLLDELGVGGGSFKINKNDPKIVANSGLLKSRNIVKCKVNGKVIGGWLIQSRKATMVASGEKSAEGYEVSGEGLTTWFNDAQVRPFAGLKTTSTDKRAFGFSAPKGDWYRDSDWVLPLGTKRYNTITGNPWKYLPTNWPEDLFPNARWVWDKSSSLHSAPAGNAYFRYDHGFPTSQQSCSLYIAASGAYTVYLDGEQIAQSDPVTGYTTKTSYEAKKVDFTVDAGEHVIGIVVTNDKAGPAGLLAGIVYYSDVSPDINLGNVTIDIGTNAYVHRVAHGLNNDDAIYLTSTGKLPGGLTTNKTYYVANKSADKFNVQATKTGVYIDTKAAQDGVHTLFKKGAVATPHIIHFTGLTQAYAKGNYNNAKTKENKARNHYNALPAGSTAAKSTKTQKAQAKKKAAAKTVWDKAKKVTSQAKHELSVAHINAPWRANFYPDNVPGPSVGEILQLLLDEAAARGVLFPTWITPTFTSTQDSNGSYWGDALDWEFDIGTSLADVVSKFADQGIDVWIDPSNYHLNAVINRGYDRTVYHYQSTFRSSTPSGPFTLNAQLNQRMQDVIRSPDTGEFYISQTDDNDNVVITRNSSGGTQLDYMTFNGAGHGTSIALEYSGGKVYIWLADTGSSHHWRFQYHTGTYSATSLPPSTTKLPMFGHSFVSAQLDWLNDRMALRTGYTYELRKISEYIKGVDKIYGKLAMSRDAVMQGFFTFLDTFYYWTGNANDGTQPPTLTGYDWSTGQVIDIWDGTSLTINAPGGWWEPEGVSLYNVDGSNPIAYLGMTYNTYPGHTFRAYTLPLRNGLPAINSTPVILDVGKNLTGADTQSSGKIKNSLALKTADGWYPTPSQDDASIDLYGVIEDTLSTSSTVAATKALAQQFIKDKSTEEDSATYTFTPTDKTPWIDFGVGDWVIAPDSSLNLQDRRVMSISISETTNGTAQYAIEFDNIFQENTARLNRIVQNLGGSGVGAGSASVAASAGMPTRVTPPVIGHSALIPLAPENVTVTAVSGWDAQGQRAITQAVVAWDHVTESEDGSELTPTAYQVWGRPIDEDDNTVTWDSSDDPNEDDPDPIITAPIDDASDGDEDPDSELVLDPDVDTAQNPWQLLSTTTATVATVGHFDPTSNWVFGLKTLNGNLTSDWSQIVDLQMDAPDEPMDPPTKPILSSKLGVLVVDWDGLLVPSGGGTEPVPSRFKDAFVGISNNPGGPYTNMGTTTGDLLKQVLVTGLTVGNTYYAVLYAEDRLGTVSPASAEASTTLTGVDLGDLSSALSANLAATQSLAANAQAIADSANTAANTAQTAANGKNRVFYSPSMPTTGMIEGDLWFNTGNGNAMSSYTSGSWVAKTLGGGALAAGAIDTAQLSTTVANSISTAQSSATAASTAASTAQSAANAAQTAANGKNKVLRSTSDPASSAGYIDGDLWYTTDSTNTSLILRMWIFRASDSTWVQRTLQNTVLGNLDAGKITTGTLAAGLIATGSLDASKITGGTITATQIATGTITGANMVAGTVTATQIATGTITALQIKGGTITADRLLAGTLTSASGVFGTMDASVITAGTLDSARIGANTITAGQIAIADFTNLFENPTFTETPGGWGQAIRGLTTNTNVRVESVNNQNYISLRGGGTSGVNTDAGSSNMIPVLPGDQFYLQADMATNSTSGGGSARLQVRWFNSTGGTISWTAAGNVDTAQTALPLGSATTWYTKGGSVTAPAGAVNAQLYVSLMVSSTTTSYASTNAIYARNLLLRRRATGVLLVDGTITATQIATGTITATQMKANTLTANEIATGAITTNELSAGAIDGMVITGATFRTSTTATTSGVVINSSGINAYSSSTAQFTVTTAGQMTAKNANITGAITATSGTISGTLTIGGSGKITSTGASSSTMTINNGQVQIVDGNLDSATLQYNGLALFYNTVSGFFGADSTGQVQVTGNADVAVAATGNALTLTGTQASYQSSTGKLVLSADSSGGYVQSPNTRARQMTAASGWAGGGAANGGTAVGSTTAFVTVDSNGTFGRLDGSPRFPSAYSDVITTRAVNVGSTGQLGTASSARRTKNVHDEQVMDDYLLTKWLAFPTVTFDYKADEQHKEQIGVIAEDVLDQGFEMLIYYDETLDDPKTKIDGFAYERMPVYNRMAIKRLLERVESLEHELSALKQ